LAAPNTRRQKEARTLLDRAFFESATFSVIHYSCESFYDRQDGRSPRITSIAVRKLDTGQTTSFSIHQVAERKQLTSEMISERYDELEREMLEAFFLHVGGHKGMKYLHWNMRDANYGFQAIEHRFQVLGGSPHVVDDSNKIDLARLLIDIYGVGYIGHPRLKCLLEKNRVAPRDFLSGEQEAEAFNNGDYVALHQSTLRKVDVLANIAGRAHDRNLITNTSWWEMNGGRTRAVQTWLAANPTFAVLAGLASIASIALALFFAA